MRRTNWRLMVAQNAALLAPNAAVRLADVARRSESTKSGTNGSIGRMSWSTKLDCWCASTSASVCAGMPRARSWLRSSETSVCDQVRIVARETGGTSTPLTSATPSCAMTWCSDSRSPRMTPNACDDGTFCTRRCTNAAKFHVVVVVGVCDGAFTSENEIGKTTEPSGMSKLATESCGESDPSECVVLLLPLAADEDDAAPVGADDDDVAADDASAADAEASDDDGVSLLVPRSPLVAPRIDSFMRSRSESSAFPPERLESLALRAASDRELPWRRRWLDARRSLDDRRVLVLSFGSVDAPAVDVALGAGVTVTLVPSPALPVVMRTDSPSRKRARPPANAGLCRMNKYRAMRARMSTDSPTLWSVSIVRTIAETDGSGAPVSTSPSSAVALSLAVTAERRWSTRRATGKRCNRVRKCSSRISNCVSCAWRNAASVSVVCSSWSSSRPVKS